MGENRAGETVGRLSGLPDSRPGRLHLFVFGGFLALLALLLFGLLVVHLVLSERDGAENEANADCECEDLFHCGDFLKLDSDEVPSG